MKKKLLCLLLMASLAGWSVHASSKTLRMLSGWDKSYPGVEMTEFYAAKLKEASDGALTIRRSGPETVPPFEQLEPVSAGIFDLLYTHPAYHMGATAFGLGLQATKGDPLKWRDNGVFDAVDDYYRQFGLKLLSLPVMGQYMIITKKPVGDGNGLSGLRIRAAPIYNSLIESLGGSATIIPPAEIYSALERGVVDGAAWPVFGPLQYKWHEVTNYMLKPTFGQNTHQIFINIRRWDRLSEQEQQLLMEAGRALEEYSYQYFGKRAAEELQALRDAGLEYSEFSPDKRALVAPAWSEGLWSYAIKDSGQAAKDLYELLKKEGMAE